MPDKGRLINVGSLCIDYVYSVPQIVVSGETLASTARHVYAGGKGLNQSIAAARGGADVLHFGLVGPDGQWLKKILAAEGVDTHGISSVETPSGHAFIQVDEAGRNAIVIHGGSNRELPETVFREAVQTATEQDWVLLQNEINDLEAILDIAAASPARIAFNVAPVDARALGYNLDLVDLLIVNEAEAIGLTGAQTHRSAFRELREKFPQTTILLTLGALGCWLSQPGGPVRVFDAFTVDPVDETAAGDAFVGYLLAGLVAGEKLQRSILEASAAGALAVTESGAAPSLPLRASVERMLAAQLLSVREAQSGEFG